MLVRKLLAAMVLLFVPSLALSPASANPNGITIATRDESFQHAMQNAYVQPFTTVTGWPVSIELWDGGVDLIRARLKATDSPWDLVLVDAEELSVGCSEGLFEKIDWSAIGGKDHYLPAAVSDCGVGALIVNTVLSWDKDKLAVTPTWSDFWDVAKYPGKRGLRKGVRGNLEIALLADGVTAGDIYKTLATGEGIDRAFRKLDQLKPYIEWWSSDAEATKILASGDVLMTSAPSGHIATAAEAQHRNFGLQFAGSLYEIQSWTMPKGTPSARIAQQFLYFIGMPAVEARLLRMSGESGMAKGLNDGLPPEVLAIAPGAPANLASGLRTDAAFWRDNLPKLRQRFDAWLNH